MITLKSNSAETVLKPTIFPDGTSQVWNIPNIDKFRHQYTTVTWYFEEEREIMDLLSVRELLDSENVSLHLPYLPYGRQDKIIHNDNTFNLNVFAKLINNMNFREVTVVDMHGSNRYIGIKGLNNRNPAAAQWRAIGKLEPDLLVFPDDGASSRYCYLKSMPYISFDKSRNQSTGEIKSIKAEQGDLGELLKGKQHLLVVDDICDGGATFIELAKNLLGAFNGYGGPILSLFVTHGLFTNNAMERLNDYYDNILTTNSLLRNKGAYPV